MTQIGIELQERKEDYKEKFCPLKIRSRVLDMEKIMRIIGLRYTQDFPREAYGELSGGSSSAHLGLATSILIASYS